MKLQIGFSITRSRTCKMTAQRVRMQDLAPWNVNYFAGLGLQREARQKPCFFTAWPFGRATRAWHERAALADAEP